MKKKTCNESREIKTELVLPTDTNNHNTLFGGTLMKHCDLLAATSARRHSKRDTVTASTDSVDFLHPIRPTDSVTFESFVSWTGNTSMEVFVKIVTEDLISGKRKVAATAFMTFVALDENGKPVEVPQVVPETEEEKMLHESGDERAEIRKKRRKKSKEMAQFVSTNRPWE